MVRRAELVALLSLGTDLGLGQPMEHMIRACLIALRLAEGAAIDDVEEASCTTRACSRGWAATLTRMSRLSGSETI